MFSVIIIACRIPESSLLYASCSSGFPWVVPVAVILRWDTFPPSMMRSDVTHLFLKEPSLTTIALPAWTDLDMCVCLWSEPWCWVFQVSGGGIVGCCWRWRLIYVFFIISEYRSSARVGELSSVGWRFISPSTFLNLLRIDRTCLLITGMYACYHILGFPRLFPTICNTPTLWGVIYHSRFQVWVRRTVQGSLTGCK